MKLLNNKGDTIVEVLIAITVVSSILGGAFVSARRSTNATRASQERVEALAIAQGQMERAITETISHPEWCYKLDGGFSLNLSECKVNDLYSPEVSVGLVATDIIVKVTWEGVGGIGPQQIELVYRKASS